MRNNEYGWTLTEMICTLVVMAIITIGGFWGYRDVMYRYKTVKMADLVTSVASSIQTKYMGYSDYLGISTDKVKDMGIIPTDLKYNKAQALHHYMDGRLEIFSVDNVKQNIEAEYFAIRLENLTSDMCFELGSIKWDNNMSSGLLAMEVVAKPKNETDKEMDNVGEYCTGIDADLFAAPDRGYAIACKNGARQSFPIMPRYAWKACNCTHNTCMITWVYK
ncbi:MAG: hypothetical protein IJ532_06395 [Alphaproteobacteria bacterium]|nr:hypothetical protein [Alphaproteobacteria bacterium]